MKNLTPKAEQNLKNIFGKNQSLANSELWQTDGEFMSNYANFAFDEVFSQSSDLDLQERIMLILGSLISVGGEAEYKIMLEAALNNGISPIAIKEIVYQATPYIGIGKSMEFILATNEVFKAKNISLPLANQGKVKYENRQENGLETQRSIFGSAIDKGNASTPEELKHIRSFLSANCFGDYYTRGGLELKFRELLTFVFLISLGGVESQVKAHIQGNLNMGQSRKSLISVVTALIPYIGYPRSLNALSAIDELTFKN
ncbi:MAG: carboxymuconolactone decarboxylase family protein [Helicobacteraceae bacterium]|nr:carboxymuconolactone decarboxylase family protein [Helicobacteraceae bacterium]